MLIDQQEIIDERAERHHQAQPKGFVSRGLQRVGHRRIRVERLVMRDSGQHQSYGAIKNRADDQCGDDAERQIALRHCTLGGG